MLAFIFQNIGVTNRYYVELGFNSATFESGTGQNTYSLHKHFGWTGLLLDGGHANASINLHREMITPYNVVSLFEKYGVPKEPDFVSIDIDSVDLWVFKSMVTGGWRPRVVTIEYNMNYPLGASMTCAPDTCTQWAGDRAYGASLTAIDQAARESGYRIVHVVRSLDAVLVREDELDGLPTHDVSHFAGHTGIAMHQPSSEERKRQIVDYAVWRATGSLEEAKRAGLAWVEGHPGVV